jgi:hypothetical protein
MIFDDHTTIRDSSEFSRQKEPPLHTLHKLECINIYAITENYDI